MTLFNRVKYRVIMSVQTLNFKAESVLFITGKFDNTGCYLAITEIVQQKMYLQSIIIYLY